MEISDFGSRKPDRKKSLCPLFFPYPLSGIRNPKFFESAYGLGEPGIVFGRVTRWTINPITVVGGIQASTVTRVAFGDWRRLASFMTQIAIPSQMATEISIGININPQAPATIPAAAFSLSSVGVAVASSCARRAAAVKRSGTPQMSRFINRLITDCCEAMSTQ